MLHQRTVIEETLREVEAREKAIRDRTAELDTR